MRLSTKEQESIHQVIKTFLQDQPHEIYLYGSRTQDHLKGGDIDLLIVMPENSTVSTLRQQSHKITAALQEKLGEQRIDLSIQNKKSIQEDPFWAQCFNSAVKI